MSESVRELTPAIVTLKSLRPKERRALVQNLNTKHMRGLTEVAVNIVKNTVPLPLPQQQACHKWRKSLRMLALKRYPTKKKKVILQKGGFLGAILPVIATVLGAALNG